MIIDEEFKNLIPPLSDSEFSQLEENILQYGIQDPLKVWNGILIDGHNRYSIAQKHNLTFNVEEMNFDSRADVINWMIKNQFGRRNISAYDRVILALKLKSLLEKQADERKKAGVKIGDNLVPILAQGRVVEQIAKIAGVGKETVRKVEKIQEISKYVNLGKLIEMLRKGEVSISFAYDAATTKEKMYHEMGATIDNLDEIETVEELRAKIKEYKNGLAKPKSSLGDNNLKLSKIIWDHFFQLIDDFMTATPEVRKKAVFSVCEKNPEMVEEFVNNVDKLKTILEQAVAAA